MGNNWIGRTGLLPGELLDAVARVHHKRECTVYGMNLIPYKNCPINHENIVELILVDLCEAFHITRGEVDELLRQRAV